MTVTSQFADATSLSNYFWRFFFFFFFLFFSKRLVIGPSFMSISSLVLELLQFSFTRDQPEIWMTICSYHVTYAFHSESTLYTPVAFPNLHSRCSHRNLKIGNTPIWVLLNIWRLGQIRDTKFGTNVFNEMLLNAAKYQGYSFYCFWVFKGKPTGGLKLPHPQPHPTPLRLGLKISVWNFKTFGSFRNTYSQVN